MMGERPAAGICRANRKSAIMDTRRYGSMAEQRFCKPWVGGSTPSTGSRNFFEAVSFVGAASIVKNGSDTRCDLQMC